MIELTNLPPILEGIYHVEGKHQTWKERQERNGRYPGTVGDWSKHTGSRSQTHDLDEPYVCAFPLVLYKRLKKPMLKRGSASNQFR